MGFSDQDVMLDDGPAASGVSEREDEAIAAARKWLAADRIWHEEGERWRRVEPSLLAALQDGGANALLAYQTEAARYDQAARTAWSMLTRVLTSRPKTPAGAIAMLRAMRSLGEQQLQHPDLGTALSSVIRLLETGLPR